MAFKYTEDDYKKDQNLIAHANTDGTAHSGGPEHDFMHGRRGTNTWPDGRRQVPIEQLKKQNNELRKELGYTKEQWIKEFGNTGGNQISKKKTKKTKIA
tara:strand:- start:2088 stop:2384 length:297 start_codon:yes stop_codon:yes gene_type:complete